MLTLISLSDGDDNKNDESDDGLQCFK